MSKQDIGLTGLSLILHEKCSLNCLSQHIRETNIQYMNWTYNRLQRDSGAITEVHVTKHSSGTKIHIPTYTTRNHGMWKCIRFH